MEVSKKRSHAEFEADQAQSANTGLGSTLALLKTPDLPTFGVGNRHKVNGENRAVDEAGWTTVSSNKKRKGKKVPKPDSSRYPAIAFSSSSNLQFQIQIQHLQDLVLYLLADGRSPQWISVQNRSAVRKVVVLMAPGLEKDMFTGDVLRQVTLGGETGNEKPPDSDEDKDENKDQGISKQHGSTAKTSVPHIDVQTYKTSPDFYLPVRLVEDSLPESLKPLAHIFRDLWPVRTPGDDRYHKMHSPIQRMLSLSVVKDKSDRTPADPATLRSSKEPRSQRVPVTELLCSLETLQEYEFVPHPAMFEDEHSRLEEAAHRQRQGQSIENGWMDTDVQDIKQGSVDESKIEQGSTTAGREIIAVDCEMCKTEDGELDLTRISLVDWDGEVILDELVKPTKTIIDYLTP
jgi:RNA exonuclease 1